MSFASMHNDYLSPPDESQVVDLAEAIAKAGMPNIVGYWDEDGQLFAGRQYDEDGRLPHAGELVWDDDKSEDENNAAAAQIVVGIFAPNEGKRKALWAKLHAYQSHKRTHPAKVPTFSAWCKSMDFPKGDFEWDDTEPGDAHVYNCGESDCPVGWHKSYYAQTIERKDGKLSIIVRQGDEDGNWDVSDGYEQGEPRDNWVFFYRAWLADTDDFFIGWTEYHLECASSNTDPLGEFMDANKACSSAAHLDAAADILKYLKVPA